MRARLTLLLPRAGFGALVATCALVPLVFSRQTAEAFNVPKLTVLWLGLIIATAGLAAWGLATRRWPVPRTLAAAPLAVLVGWTTLATALSISPMVSLVGQYGRYDGLLGLAAGTLVVALVVGYTWKQPERLEVVALAIVASGVVAVGYVTIQRLGWDWVNWYNEALEPIERPYGLLGNSNFSGAHLAIVIPFVLALRTRSDRRLAHWAAWALVGWLAVGVWWTATRGGMLALVGGVAVAGALAPDLLPRIVRWGSAALTVAALGVVITTAASSSTVPGTVQSGTPRFLQSNTLADRKEIWTAGLHMVADEPIVGVGPDAFGLRFPYYRLPFAVDEPPLNADEAHNVFIDRAATSGIPALVAYLWLVAATALAAWRARLVVSETQRRLVGGFGGALAAYLLQGLVSIDVIPLAVLSWVSIGALVVLSDPILRGRRTDDEGQPVVVRPLPVGVLAGGAAVGVLLVTQALRPFMADVQYRRGVELTSAGQPGAAAAAEFHDAALWVPTEPRYRARLADQLVAMATREVNDPEVRARLLREAVTGYDQALDRAPGDAIILRTKARALVLLGDADRSHRSDHLEAAAAIYTSLVDRIEADRELRMEYGLILEMRAEGAGPDEAHALRDQASQQFERVLQAAPESTTALSGLARVALAEDRLEQARTFATKALELRPDDEGIAALLADIDRKIAAANP